jgi:AcrR family transcriptional regulator
MSSTRALSVESQREKALLALAELWGEVGYAQLTVTAICNRAGITPDAFAAEFPDLESAAQATFEVPITAVVGIVAHEYGQDRSEPESCALGILAILELMAANPAYAYIVYIGRRQRVPRKVQSTARTAYRFIVAMLDRLRESTAAGEQPTTAGVGSLGAAEAVIRREISAGRLDRLPALAPDFVYAATVPFVGQGEAQRLARVVRERAKPV